MDITSYEKLTVKEIYYEEVSVEDLTFYEDYMTIDNKEEEYGNIVITDSLRDAISRYVGLSSSLNKGLYNTDKELWYKVLVRLYSYYSKENIILLMSLDDDNNYYVKGLCGTSREPLNSINFIDKVISYYQDYADLKVLDIQYDKDLTISTVCIGAMDKTYTDATNNKFNLGVVFVNDELYNTYCRLALIYENGCIYYLPSKFYNLTSSRYDKTTVNSEESLDMLMLRVYEDLSSDRFNDIAVDLNTLISNSFNKHLSRMEFERAYSQVSIACAASDMSEEQSTDILQSLLEFDDYEDLYGSLNSDYLWKCTAIGGTTLADILKVVGDISVNNGFYLNELKSIREFLGEFLAVPRVCQVLAKKL